MKKQCLLIEDEATLIVCLTDMLEARGYEVTTLTSVRGFRRGKIVGVGIDDSVVEFALSDQVFAVVDGMLPGKFQGWEIVPYLVDSDVVCIAHSSEDGLNRHMKEKGAQYQALKNGTRGLKAVIEEVEKAM